MRFQKLAAVLLCLLLLCSLASPAFAAQSQTITVDPINVMVGGKVFLPTDANGKNVPVFVYEGTTYAPLRALAEAYGLTVGYNAEKRLATVDGTPSADFVGTKGTAQALTKSTALSVTSINIEVNGEVFQPKDAAGKSVPVFTYNGTTYAPLRALAEAYGLSVGYNAEKKLATVDFIAENGNTVFTADVDYKTLVAEVNAARKAELASPSSFVGYENYLVNDPSTMDLISKDELKLLIRSQNPMNQTVTYAEAVSDIDLLFRVLHVCYGAYYYFGQDAYDRAEQEVLSWLQGQDTVSVSELRDVLRKSLAFMVDAHSFVGYDVANLGGIRYKYHHCLEQVYQKDAQGFFKLIDGKRLDFVSFSDERVTMEATLLSSGRIVYSPVLFCPKNEAESSSVTLKDSSGQIHTESMEFQIIPEYSFSNESDYHFLKENGLAYLSLRDFNTQENPDTFAKFVESGCALQDCRAIIFDLRNNSGGNDSPMYDWVKNFTGELPVMREAQANRQSIFNSSNTESIFDLRYINTGKWIENGIPIFVLVDDYCASAGESALNILKTMDNVLVVGSNSSGYQLGGNAIQFTLPNTGIFSNIGTQLRFFFDMENVDCIGYTPDLWCQPDESLNAVMNLLVEYDLATTEEAASLQTLIEQDAVNKPSSITLCWTEASGETIEIGGRERRVEQPGTYYLTACFNGTPDADFTVTSSAPAFCSVEKTEDGRIKVVTTGYGCAAITVRYAAAEQTFLFECPGNEYSNAPDADPAIWLDWPSAGHTNIRPDGIFGFPPNMEQLFLVMVNGEQTKDFTVTSSDPNRCRVSRTENGSLMITAEVPGYYGIIVRVGTVERTFLFWSYA